MPPKTLSFSIPDDSLQTLKCATCKKYLSFYPIFLSSTQTSLCGRCTKMLNAKDYFRNTTYETLAKNFRFPCVFENEGCMEKLIPGEVPEHELTCTFRPISCPTDCVWQGARSLLLEHYEENHSDLILKDNEFEINLTQPYEDFQLISVDDELFSLKQKFEVEKKILTCSLFAYNLFNRKEYSYEVVITDGLRRKFHKYPKKPAKNFQAENETVISIAEVVKILDDPSFLVGKINISDHEEVKVSKEQINPEIKYDVLSELECPVCLEYITPPIYQCVTGHSICATCKTEQCPICRAEVRNTQNFVLEKVAVLLLYPCKFSEYGCAFTAKANLIKKHQSFCPHGPFECPLKDYEDCEWKNSAKEIYSHVRSTHHDNLLEVDLINVFITDDYFEKTDYFCFLMKFSNQIFKLHYSYNDKAFFWTMQLLGPAEECKNYQYEIDIVDNSNNNCRFFLRSACAPSTSKEQCFVTPGTFVYVDLELIRSFITDDFSYRARIVTPPVILK